MQRKLTGSTQVVGLVRTYAANNLITDSAASGTAFAAGYKSNNGMIGVIPDGRPVGSILEAAKVAGMRTGLVVTSTINHATPAGRFTLQVSPRGGRRMLTL
jgi:alkaline phosphatase